jgi:hypothetical protein
LQFDQKAWDSIEETFAETLVQILTRDGASPSTRTLAATKDTEELAVENLSQKIAEVTDIDAIRTSSFSIECRCILPMTAASFTGVVLHSVGERSLFHTLRNTPSAIGRAPAKRNTVSPTMRTHSSLW